MYYLRDTILNKYKKKKKGNNFSKGVSLTFVNICTSGVIKALNPHKDFRDTRFISPHFLTFFLLNPIV